MDTPDDRDLMQDAENSFNEFFSDSTDLPDAGRMVKDENEPNPLAIDRAPAPAGQPVTEDRARQMLDDRLGRERAEQELARVQQGVENAARQNVQQPQEPDFFSDPAAYHRFHMNQLRQDMETQMILGQRALARQLSDNVYTAPVVDAAIAAIQDAERKQQIHPAEAQRIMASPNPFAEVVAWHKRQNVMQEVGDDPAAYKKKIEDELLHDPAFQARAIAASRGQNLAAVPAPAAPPAAAPARPKPLPSISNVGSTATARAVAADLNPDDAFSAMVPD